MATWTGLEPVTSAVTGRHSNQLNYQATPKTDRQVSKYICQYCRGYNFYLNDNAWWVKRGSNPRHSPCKGDALPAELFTQAPRLRILPTTLGESIKVSARNQCCFACEYRRLLGGMTVSAVPVGRQLHGTQAGDALQVQGVQISVSILLVQLL